MFQLLILDNFLCLCLDDYIAIGADEEELGSQIEEDILCVYMHNCFKQSARLTINFSSSIDFLIFILFVFFRFRLNCVVLMGKERAICVIFILFVFLSFKSKTYSVDSIFLFLFKIVFIFRERMGGRKRETSMCDCLLHTPYWGPRLQTTHVP